MDKDQLELFNAWFYRAKHRAKYTDDHPAYLAAQEAWEAWLDAPDTPPRQSRSDVKPLTDAQIDLMTNHIYHRGKPVDRDYRICLFRQAEAAHGIMSVSDGKGDA